MEERGRRRYKSVENMCYARRASTCTHVNKGQTLIVTGSYGHCRYEADLLREARVWPRRRRLVLFTLHKRFFISSMADERLGNCVTSDSAKAQQAVRTAHDCHSHTIKCPFCACIVCTDGFVNAKNAAGRELGAGALCSAKAAEALLRHEPGSYLVTRPAAAAPAKQGLRASQAHARLCAQWPPR